MRRPIQRTLGTAHELPSALYRGPSGHCAAVFLRQGMAVYGVSTVNSIEKLSGNVSLGMHPAMARSAKQHKVAAVESQDVVISPRSDVVNVALLWPLSASLALAFVSCPDLSALVAPDEIGKERLMLGSDPSLPLRA